MAPDLFQGRQAPVAAVLLKAGLLLFGQAHNAATILRICDDPELRRRHKILVIWSPLALVFLCVAALTNGFVLVACAKAYLLLSAKHITAQCYGITVLYCRKARLSLGRREVQALKAAFAAMMLASVARNFSTNAIAEALGVRVPVLVLFPEWLGWTLAAIAVVSTAAAFLLLARDAHQNNGHIPPGAALTAFTTLVLFMALPNMWMAAIYGQAFFHASQYVVMTASVYLKRTRADSAASPNMVRHWSFPRQLMWYWGRVVLLGMIINIAIPFGVSQIGISPSTTLAAVFFSVTFHHFLADSVMWRMRDKKTRELLVA